jgi:hypothetical protein
VLSGNPLDFLLHSWWLDPTIRCVLGCSWLFPVGTRVRNMDKAEEELLHEYEEQLDAHHKSLSLWRWSRSEAIYAVMSIPDAAYLLPMSAALAQKYKGLEEGVSQALRWLTEEGCTSVRSAANYDLMKEAGQFCMHASDYVAIADFHISRGRGLAAAHVDSSSRTITFDAVEGSGQSAASTWYEDICEQSRRGRSLAKKKRVKRLDIRRALEVLSGVEYQLVGGHIQLGRLPHDLVDRTSGALQLCRDFEPVPLSPATDMLGFTMGEFWSFVEAVTLWSYAALMRYNKCVTQGIPQHECMPTQTVEVDEFVDQVKTLSCLSAESVEMILDRLTFHPGPKADILLTPFLRGECSICWSPAVIVDYAHERNLLKVMSRGSKALCEHAATVNGSRGRVLGRLIGVEFAKRGYQFNLDTPIASSTEKTDVDVLLYQTTRPDEVLIVQAKAIIAPDEINEVDDATKTLAYAQEQARRTMRILRVMPAAQKRQKFKFVNWDAVTQLFGVVATPDAEPHSLVDPREIPVLTLVSLRWRFRPRDFWCPSRFWKACVQRPWVEREMREEKHRHRDIKVGDLVYRLPECMASTSADERRMEKADWLPMRRDGTQEGN